MPNPGADLQTALSPETTRAARRNLIVTLLGRGTSVGLNLLITLYTIRYLGVERYGVYVVIFNIINLLDLATEIPLFEIAVREMAKSDHRIPDWLGALTLLRLCLGVVVTTALLLASLWLYFWPTASVSPEASPAVAVGAVLYLINALRTPIAVFRARLAIHWELGLWSLARVFELGLVIAVAHWHGGIAALLGTKTIAAGAFVIACWGVLLARWRTPLRKGPHLTRELIVSSIPLALTAIMMMIQLRGDTLLIAAVRGEIPAGGYGAVAQIPEFALVIVNILAATLGPVLAKCVGEGSRGQFQAVYQRVYDALLVFIPPACALACVFAGPLVHLMFGEKYMDFTREFQFMVWAGGLMQLAGMLGVAAVTLNLQRNLVRVEFGNVCIYVVGNLLLLPLAGTVGVGAIRLLVVIVGPALTYLIIRRHSPYRLSNRLAAWSLPLTVVSAAAALATRGVHPIVGALAGASVYAAGVLLLKPLRRVALSIH